MTHHIFRCQRKISSFWPKRKHYIGTRTTLGHKAEFKSRRHSATPKSVKYCLTDLVSRSFAYGETNNICILLLRQPSVFLFTTSSVFSPMAKIHLPLEGKALLPLRRCRVQVSLCFAQTSFGAVEGLAAARSTRGSDKILYKPQRMATPFSRRRQRNLPFAQTICRLGHSLPLVPLRYARPLQILSDLGSNPRTKRNILTDVPFSFPAQQGVRGTPKQVCHPAQDLQRWVNNP